MYKINEDGTIEIKVELEIRLTQENIDDIMVTALEGGITYWCSEAEVVGDYLGEYGSEQISRGGKLKIHDCEEDAVYELDMDKFIKGFEMAVKNGYLDDDCLDNKQTYFEVDTGMIDSCGADCIVQCALFNEVIYG